MTRADVSIPRKFTADMRTSTVTATGTLDRGTKVPKYCPKASATAAAAMTPVSTRSTAVSSERRLFPNAAHAYRYSPSPFRYPEASSA